MKKARTSSAPFARFVYATRMASGRAVAAAGRPPMWAWRKRLDRASGVLEHRFRAWSLKCEFVVGEDDGVDIRNMLRVVSA